MGLSRTAVPGATVWTFWPWKQHCLSCYSWQVEKRQHQLTWKSLWRFSQIGSLTCFKYLAMKAPQSRKKPQPSAIRVPCSSSMLMNVGLQSVSLGARSAIVPSPDSRYRSESRSDLQWDGPVMRKIIAKESHMESSGFLTFPGQSHQTCRSHQIRLPWQLISFCLGLHPAKQFIISTVQWLLKEWGQTIVEAVWKTVKRSYQLQC